MVEPVFEALTGDTLSQRLGTLRALSDRIGPQASGWQVREVGDGNLNLVFIVEGSQGTAVVKQALPYVRLVGDSWPLTLKRSFFEYQALIRQVKRDPGMVPEVFHFDERQALIVMEFLSPHVIMRRALMDGRELPRVGADLGRFLARTLFRGSDLHMDARQRKNDLALFAANDELCGITENLVFSDPYFEAKLNRHTSPQLDAIAREIRADSNLKVQVQVLKHAFTTRAETLLHGDLHTGSIMVTEDETRIIDPEFAFYGPMAFDVGMLLANIWMSYFSQRGHERAAPRDSMRGYLLATSAEIWDVFCAEFSTLWKAERTGILYDKNLFELQGDHRGVENALDRFMRQLWTDTLGFAGIEMHRRILGLAHNADFEAIEDLDTRAGCELAALRLGSHLIVNRHMLADIPAINQLAAKLEAGENL